MPARKTITATAGALLLAGALTGCGPNEGAFVKAVRSEVPQASTMSESVLLDTGYKACATLDQGYDAEVFGVAQAFDGEANSRTEVQRAQEIARLADKHLCD